MGLVTRAEADRASKIVSRISGVTRVVTVFEYLPG
jgi:osmotically-inducible protein OsmY